MRSRSAFFASLAFLLALPVAWLCQVLVGGGAETAIHVALAIGAALVAVATFDFATPRWITWLACVGAGSLGAVFLLQAIALATDSVLLSHVVFRVLGQGPERWLGDVVLAWLVVVLLLDSEGATRALGWLAVPPAVGFEIVTQVLRYQEASSFDSTGALKLLLLAPFVWLLAEGAKNPTTG